MLDSRLRKFSSWAAWCAAHDVDGAHQAGVECVGVLWGYGDEAELGHAEHLAHDVSELARLLGG